MLDTCCNCHGGTAMGENGTPSSVLATNIPERSGVVVQPRAGDDM